jgi:hypothetical protein
MAAAKRAMGPASHRPYHARHRWLRADHARHPRRVIRAAGMVWCGWPFVRIGGQRAAGSRPQLDGGFAPRLGRPDSLHRVRRADRRVIRPSLAGSTAARSAIDTNTCLDLEPGTGRLAQRVVRSQTTITGIAARFARETLSVWAAAPPFIHQPPQMPPPPSRRSRSALRRRCPGLPGPRSDSRPRLPELGTVLFAAPSFSCGVERYARRGR